MCDNKSVITEKHGSLTIIGFIATKHDLPNKAY